MSDMNYSGWDALFTNVIIGVFILIVIVALVRLAIRTMNVSVSLSGVSALGRLTSGPGREVLGFVGRCFLILLAFAAFRIVFFGDLPTDAAGQATNSAPLLFAVLGAAASLLLGKVGRGALVLGVALVCLVLMSVHFLWHGAKPAAEAIDRGFEKNLGWNTGVARSIQPSLEDRLRGGEIIRYSHKEWGDDWFKVPTPEGTESRALLVTPAQNTCFDFAIGSTTNSFEACPGKRVSIPNVTGQRWVRLRPGGSVNVSWPLKDKLNW